MTIAVDDVRRALETLWTDVTALATNPLVEQLGVVDAGERDAYRRAMALIDAILEAAQRLKTDGGAAHFALLNVCYGLAGTTRQCYELGGRRPTPEQIVTQVGADAGGVRAATCSGDCGSTAEAC